MQGLQRHKPCTVTMYTKWVVLEKPTTENNIYEILKKCMRFFYCLGDKITVAGFEAIFTQKKQQLKNLNTCISIIKPFPCISELV